MVFWYNISVIKFGFYGNFKKGLEINHKNMASNERQPTDKQKIKIGALIFFLIFLVAANLLIYGGWSVKKIALAISGNYSKSSGQQLTTADWNNLDDDFVAKSGDTMSGALNMGSQRITGLANPAAGTDAVNQSTMNAAIGAAIVGASPIKDYASSANLRMFCGRTTPADWIPMAGGYARVDIDFSGANFASSNPFVFTSIGGNGLHYLTRGASSIYPHYGGLSADRGFSVYVYNDSGQPYPYNSFGWHINWCALGS